MHTLIAIVCFVLSQFGIDVGSQVYVDHIRAGGTDTLYSKVVAQPAVTRFECVRSASGQCYYTLFPRECAADCPGKSVGHFALATGDTRQIAALSGFRVCVSADAGRASPDCGAPGEQAAR